LVVGSAPCSVGLSKEVKLVLRLYRLSRAYSEPLTCSSRGRRENMEDETE
ncbi:hypothetical protein BDW72DRAFT_170388, partial [Aspergillus terricola var. indicus]